MTREAFKLRKVVYYGVQANGIPAEGWTEVKLSIDGCTVGEVPPHYGSCS